MGIVVLFMGFAALFGFYQTYHWDIVTLVAALGAMVPGATILMDHLLYPETRERFERETKFVYMFLGAVSVFAYLAFANGKSDFRRADNPLTHYAALWCMIYPYCCAMLLALDRLFNVFGGRGGQKSTELLPEDQVDWRKVYEEKFGPYQNEEDESAETDAVIKFDPKRFH